MISRYEAILNGIALSSLHPNILVLDVQYNAPDTQYNTYNVAHRQGGRIHRENTQSITASVMFEIHSYNVQERQRICALVSGWAKNGGILEINDRPGQRLRCVCTKKPSIQSAQKWTEAVTVEFTAYALPYWEETQYAVKTFTAGTTGEGTLYVPGNEDGAFFEADITANAALSSVAITVNGQTMTLSNLSVAAEDVIQIRYDDQMIQSIKVGTASLLGKRTGADDLVAKCGEANNISFTASASVTVSLKARGLWS